MRLEKSFEICIYFIQILEKRLSQFYKKLQDKQFSNILEAFAVSLSSDTHIPFQFS